MKKLATIILAAAIVMTTCFTAFAADSPVYTIPDATYVKGSMEDVTVVCNGDFDKFVGINVDDAAISEFSAVSGSTVATIKASYLETLAVGAHTMQFVYTDGTSNVATLNIVEKCAPKKGAPVEKKAAATSPKTGQDASVYFAALLAVCAGLGAVVVSRRKRA